MAKFILDLSEPQTGHTFWSPLVLDDRYKTRERSPRTSYGKESYREIYDVETGETLATYFCPNHYRPVMDSKEECEAWIVAHNLQKYMQVSCHLRVVISEGFVPSDSHHLQPVEGNWKQVSDQKAYKKLPYGA